MKFIVGIGNPGKKYEETRHNIGFQVLRSLRLSLGAGSQKTNKNFNAVVWTVAQDFLVEPQTFVNQTGRTIRAIVQEHRLLPGDFLIVCDDVNLEFGKMRLRDSGSAGGHHGLESIIAELGSEDFPRLRIGIGSSEMPAGDLASYVLSEFDAPEKKRLDAVLEKAVRVCDRWLKEDFKAARSCLSRLQSV